MQVAVIDTGIDLDHPDLSASAARTACSRAPPADDDEGHGTHVAGLDRRAEHRRGRRRRRARHAALRGEGPRLRPARARASQVICGIDWVTSTRTDADPSNDIAVANMSLGGSGSRVRTCAQTTDPEHLAICRSSTAAGVTYVVAAGNDGWDFDYAPVPDTPAAYPEVLTVIGDGRQRRPAGAGGGAPACSPRTMPTTASRASRTTPSRPPARPTRSPAPGVCIRSSIPGGGYDTYSGTSMASPHAAGAVALCLGEGGAAGPVHGA